MKQILKLFRPVYRILYPYFEKMVINIMNKNSNSIRMAIQFVNHNYVEGDFLEFGCYKGRTLALAYHEHNNIRKGLLEFQETFNQEKSSFLESKVRFFGFDSFEGLPEPTGKDVTSYNPETWQKGAVACSRDQVLKNLEQWNVDLDDITTVKGFYDETLNEETRKLHNLQKAAYIHIDCDFYESTVPVLKFVTPLIQEGSVIVFDDWFRYKNNENFGEQRAFAEWRQENPQFKVTELARHRSHSIAFIINPV